MYAYYHGFTNVATYELPEDDKQGTLSSIFHLLCFHQQVDFLNFIVNESDSRVLAGIRALYPTKNDPFASAKTQCENQLLIDAIAMLERRHTFKLLVFSGEFYYEIVEDGILPVFKFIAY